MSTVYLQLSSHGINIQSDEEVAGIVSAIFSAFMRNRCGLISRSSTTLALHTQRCSCHQ